MSLKQFTVGAILSGALVAAGCEEKPAAPTATDTSTAAPAGGVTVPPTLQHAQDQAKATADAAQQKAADTGNQAAAAAQDAGAKAEAAGDSMVAQAQKLYDDAKAAINKADFAGAQKYVDQLTALKSKLPADWQAKVDEVSKMLATAKSNLGGLNVPAMPK